MNDDKSELRECPFCGGENIYISSSRCGAKKITRVACSECPAMTESSVLTMDEINKAWNTRTEHSKQSEWVSVDLLLTKADARLSSAMAQSAQAKSIEFEATHEGRIRELHWLIDELQPPEDKK